MPLTNAAESDLLALLFQNTNWANVGDATGLRGSSTAGSWYVSLHTSNPGQTGNQSTNEAAWGGYLRQATARSSGGWTLSGSNPTQVANAALITYPTCTSGTETDTYFGVGSASSGAGELAFYSTLAQAIVVATGIIPIFPISSLICKMQ